MRPPKQRGTNRNGGHCARRSSESIPPPPGARAEHEPYPGFEGYFFLAFLAFFAFFAFFAFLAIVSSQGLMD
jgi:hypothetical protein